MALDRMKLYGTTSSPYVRKVRVAALELGLPAELEPIDLTEWAQFGAINPIHRVPVLEFPDGRRMFDSQVICEYLDTLAGRQPPLFPPPPQRWEALRMATFGNGIMDAAVPRRGEAARPSQQQSPTQLASYERSIRQILDELERQPPAAAAFDIGGICVASALAYLDFRFPGDDWRNRRPRLAAWFDAVSTRPSMTATRHPAPTVPGLADLVQPR